MIKEKCVSYIQDYLVNKFLKSIKASRSMVLIVNAALSLDAAYVLRILLAKYGFAKFANVVFWISMIL